MWRHSNSKQLPLGSKQSLIMLLLGFLFSFPVSRVNISYQKKRTRGLRGIVLTGINKPTSVLRYITMWCKEPRAQFCCPYTESKLSKPSHAPCSGHRSTGQQRCCKLIQGTVAMNFASKQACLGAPAAVCVKWIPESRCLNKVTTHLYVSF